MDLESWLKSKEVKKGEFARKIGVSAPYLTRLANGQRTPSLELALTISKETRGQVPPTVWKAA